MLGYLSLVPMKGHESKQPEGINWECIAKPGYLLGPIGHLAKKIKEPGNATEWEAFSSEH